MTDKIKNNNTIILKFLKEKILTTENENAPFPIKYLKKPTELIDNIYFKGDLTRKNTMSSLDYNKGHPILQNTFIAEATYKELSNILGKPEDFSKKTSTEKAHIQEQIIHLNKDEYEWKTLIKRTANKPSACHHDLFRKEYSNFLKNITDSILPKKDNKESRMKVSERNHIRYKIMILSTGLSAFIHSRDPYQLFKEILTLGPNDYDLIIDQIEAECIFNDVCRIILKAAHDTTFNSMSRGSRKYVRVFTDDALIAKKSYVAKDFEIALATYYMNVVICYVEQIKNVEVDHQAVCKILRRNLRHNQHYFSLSKEKWWEYHCDGARTILSLLEECNLFEVKSDVKRDAHGRARTDTNYVVPFVLDDTLVSFTNFPRVTPKRITRKTFQDIQKPVWKGQANITRSDKFIETLNISGFKKHRINETYLSILEALFILDDPEVMKALSGLNLPFVFHKDLEEGIKKEEIYNENKLITPELGHVLDQLEMQMGSIMGRTKFTKSLFFSLIGNSGAFKEASISKQKQKRENDQKLSDRKWARTILELAVTYKNFPLYITDAMCGRGRLYPEQPLISRTSGIYKHLLCEYSEKKLTLQGFINFLKAYYKPCSESTLAFNHFTVTSVKSNKDVKLLKKYFENNPLEFSKTGKRFPYFLLMHAEIQKAFVTGKTAMCLEIDQVASSVMILSYFLRDKHMARISNVIGGPKSDPYAYCMNKFSEFYETHIKKKKNAKDSKKFYDFFSTNRKVHKYALMCYTYSQTQYGRKADFVESFQKEYGEHAFESVEMQMISEFATDYPIFIDFVFKGVIKKLDLIKKVVDIVVKETYYLPFSNIQGEKFEWSFYKYTTKTRASYDVIKAISKTRKIYKLKERDSLDTVGPVSSMKPYRSYKHDEFDVETSHDKDGNEVKRLLCDVGVHHKKALSYMIHCIDASIIHRFIYQMKHRHNYTIDHLHDCVILHPNMVDAFYEEVRILYTSKDLYNMIDKSFFDQIISRVSDKSQQKILDIRKEFLDLSDDYADLLVNIVPENAYEFEG